MYQMDKHLKCDTHFHAYVRLMKPLSINFSSYSVETKKETEKIWPSDQKSTGIDVDGMEWNGHGKFEKNTKYIQLIIRHSHIQFIQHLLGVANYFWLKSEFRITVNRYIYICVCTVLYSISHICELFYTLEKNRINQEMESKTSGIKILLLSPGAITA